MAELQALRAAHGDRFDARLLDAPPATAVYLGAGAALEIAPDGTLALVTDPQRLTELRASIEQLFAPDAPGARPIDAPELTGVEG
ncbi:MAG: hypothetical protein U0232_21640 [Thermomicrobiales bacterium]